MSKISGLWKKTAAFCMVFCMILSLSACGGSQSSSETQQAVGSETQPAEAAEGSKQETADQKNTESADNTQADTNTAEQETSAAADDAAKETSAATDDAAKETAAADTEAAEPAETAASNANAAQASEKAASDVTAAQASETAASAVTAAQASETAASDATTAQAAETAVLPDYSNQDNWAYFAIGEDMPADLFLICPTVDTKDEYNMSLEDEAVKKSFSGALNMERGIYEDSTRMYAPYYRQAAMKIYDLNEEEREQYLELAYKDVSAAFAWYLENENAGRPLVLAGFSQGADMCYRLLEEYFDDSALAGQLVAVYAIGWPMTEEMTSQYPQIKPAAGADDTGVVVSFDCESPELEETFINPREKKAITINPLNWMTDSTPADKSLNTGACFTDYSGEIKQEETGLCGCYIDEERGVLKVTDITPAEYPPILPILPEGSYHLYDYQFYFRNLQQNVNERVNAYIN